MLVEFIIGTAVLFVILLLFSKKKKPNQDATISNGSETGDWEDEYGVQFSSDKETLLKAPTNLKEYTIPNGVISIRSNAFDGCSNLKSVTFPNSVKQIGRFVFNKCDSLSAIHIPAGNMERFKRMLPSDLHSILIEPNAPRTVSDSETTSNKDMSTNEQGRPGTSGQVDYVKELEKIILEYCEDTSSYNSKPSFPITKSTNFGRDLNFDGIDMASISALFEKKFPFEIPDDHPINQRSADDTDFTVGCLLSAYGLCDDEDEKKEGITKKDTKATTPEKESRGKLMRPKFTDEEALAMGRLAVSIVGRRINQPEAMIKFSMEYDGYTMGDIRAMTNMGMPEFLKSVSIFSSMLDPIKKSYAAGFFAAIIKACGCENDSTVYTAYKNCLDNVLRMGGMDDINVAAGFYEGCEHGKR